MFTAHITAAEKYAHLKAKFAAAYAFLAQPDLAGLPLDKRMPVADGVTAELQAYVTEPAEARRFETHDRHFDVQYVLEGEERFGHAARRDLGEAVERFVDRDVAFYKEPDHAGCVILRAGDFALVAPEDGHKPRCAVAGPAPVRKIVIKIAL